MRFINPIRRFFRKVAFATTAGSADIPENEHKWRGLFKRDRLYDLTNLDQQRAQVDAIRNWRASPLYKRHLDITAAYVVGSGDVLPQIVKAKTKATQKLAQEKLRELWLRNGLQRRLQEWCVQTFAVGESFTTMHFGGDMDPAGAGSRKTRLGWLDPTVVGAVLTDPEDAHTRVAAIVETGPGVPDKVFPLIRQDGTIHPELSLPKGSPIFLDWPGMGTQKVEGAIGAATMYLPVNVTPGQTRGLPDAYPVLDLLGVHMDYLWQASERGLNANAVNFHASLEGANDTECNKFAQKFKERVEAGTGNLLVTNEKVNLSAVAAALQSQDFATWEKTIVLRIAAGFGIPEHWLSEGGNVNVATAGEMAGPTLTALAMKQAAFVGYVEDICWWALRLFPEIESALEDDPEAFDIHIPVPDLISKDAMRSASVLQTNLASIDLARDERFISDEEAQRLGREEMGKHGYELRDEDKPDAEKPKITGLPFPMKDDEDVEDAEDGEETEESQAANPPRAA